MRQLIQRQRLLLLKRLDVLSDQLKTEVDSMRAEKALEEMRNIGKLLQELVSSPVADHSFINNLEFKEHGKTGHKAKLVNSVK